MATNSLLTEPVGRTLWQQSAPMAVGIVFMLLVNLIDTYWVSFLGTEELAAMSFAFPVIGVVLNISLGLMVGTSVAISRVLGAGDRETADRLSTHAILLGLLIASVVCGVGIFTIRPLFTLLNAEPTLLPYIERFMVIWYVGAVALVVPMMINGILRAHGDAATSRNVFVLAAIVNAVLDPLLIFGLGPIPALELEGAALATAISRAVGGVYAVVIVLRARALDLSVPRISEVIASWRRILQVGVPAIITNVLGPIATAMFVAIVSTYGSAAVAGYGIGARVESLVLIAASSLSSGLSPFVGQNWGAHLQERVVSGVKMAVGFSVVWGLAAFLLLLPTAPLIAGLFTNDPAVAEAITLYLRIVPLGFAAYGAMMQINSTLNAVDHATEATILSVVRSIVVAVPVAWLGSRFLGLPGAYLGLVAGSFIAALIGVRWLRVFLDPEAEMETERAKPVDNIDFLINAAAPGLRPQMSSLVDAISGLEDVRLRRIRSDAVGFFCGKRQLGHIHPSGHLDLPLPVEIGEFLCGRGVLEHHRLHDNNGWFTHLFHNEKEVSRAEWVLRLSHALYEIKKRGPEAPLTNQELDTLDIPAAGRAAVIAAAQRWDVPCDQVSKPD